MASITIPPKLDRIKQAPAPPKLNDNKGSLPDGAPSLTLASNKSEQRHMVTSPEPQSKPDDLDGHLQHSEGWPAPEKDTVQPAVIVRNDPPVETQEDHGPK